MIATASGPLRTEAASRRGDDELPFVRRKRWGHWLVIALLVFGAAAFLDVIVLNPRFGWPLVWQYMFDPRVLDGVRNSLLLTAVSYAIGLALGLFIALMRQSSSRVIRSVSIGYLWVMRALPPLVSILFIYYLGAILPTITLGIPFTGLTLLGVSSNTVITQFGAAVVALSLVDAAYTSEIIRGGLTSVPAGQWEASRALGMPTGLAVRRIILPQAIRVMIPGLGNQLILAFKATALVSFIGYSELLNTVQTIANITYQTIPLLAVATIWYLAITSVAMVGVDRLEKRFGKGVARAHV